MNSTSARLVALLGAFASTVACSGRDVLVTAGSPLPAQERPGDPFATLSDRTGVGGYEFGRCSDERDCEPRECGGGVCAPIAESDGVCRSNDVTACLGSIDRSLCGCVDGYCRWARTAPVLHCASLAGDPAGTLPFAGAQPTDLYPVRISD